MPHAGSWRLGCHSATTTFGSKDAQTAFFEVDVFDSEIQGFSDSQSTSVEKMDNESGGIAVNIVNVGQELTLAFILKPLSFSFAVDTQSEMFVNC